jgi:hypothetical protein
LVLLNHLISANLMLLAAAKFQEQSRSASWISILRARPFAEGHNQRANSSRLLKLRQTPNLQSWHLNTPAVSPVSDTPLKFTACKKELFSSWRVDCEHSSFSAVAARLRFAAKSA